MVFPLLIPIILIAGTAGSLAIQAGTSQTPKVKQQSQFEEFKPILIIVAIIIVFMLLLGGKKRR